MKSATSRVSLEQAMGIGDQYFVILTRRGKFSELVSGASPSLEQVRWYEGVFSFRIGDLRC